MKLSIKQDKYIEVKTLVEWGGKFYLDIMLDSIVSFMNSNHQCAAQWYWCKLPPEQAKVELKKELDQMKLTKRLSKEFKVTPDELPDTIMAIMKQAFPNGPRYKSDGRGGWDKVKR